MAQSSPRPHRTLKQALRSNLLMIGGKGGVGKTLLSRAIAQASANAGKKTLWVTLEDPTLPPGELIQLAPQLWHLNAESLRAFDEYIGLKIGVPALAHFFLKNKVIQYLAKAAPGLHELVLLGKIWHERRNYDHVVVDMPSTGYGVAMFQSTANFARLFGGGPLNRDALSMLETFGDPLQSSHIIVGLPEEMPLQESLELSQHLLQLFPQNPAAFIVNKRFPSSTGTETQDPDQWPSPLAQSALDYVQKRGQLETFNMKIWTEEGIEFESIPHYPAHASEQSTRHLEELAGWTSPTRAHT